MPRIDPQQLLNCLQVLLNPNGGILSQDEVLRLANLMTKFSKKLVSKCIYVLILKNTERTLLGSFMSEGGWNLIHMWLQDAHANKNWALVIEILQLLLLTPVDVERLKMNNLPKLVKSLTKRDDLSVVQHLASSLVEEWLKIVKDVTRAEAKEKEASEMLQDPLKIDNVPGEVLEEAVNDTTDSAQNPHQIKDNQENVEPSSNNVDAVSMEVSADIEDEKNESEEKKDKKTKSDDRNKRSSSSSKSSKDKDSRSDKSRSKHSSSSKSSRDKDKDRKEKDRHRSSSSSSSKHKSSRSSSSSSSKDKDRNKDKDKKESKEKQSEKDKDTLSKIQPPTIDKLGRIPRKSDNDKSKSIKKEEVKKPTFSVEVRKTDEKPKTVKIFNSKMRSTGLLEEAKPPPPRSTKKPVITPPPVPIKRPSPIRDSIPPPEKKSRLLEPIERPGAIKLIPPKPKPAVLQESDIFMDALTASATSKKEPKKRKRKPSVTKEPTPPPADIPTSPTNLKNITSGANFYQDTLETETEPASESTEDEIKSGGVEDKEGSPKEAPQEEGPELDTVRTDSNGLRGVLSYSKRKGPKKSIKWKPEADLVEIQYFELDETERVNVMKTFGDMAKLEMSGEREALRSRKLINEDIMELQTQWRVLIELDLPPSQVDIGSKSLEKEIQFAREKRVLQTIYFNNRIPDTPSDPDPETHPMTDPVVIPLEDPDNPDVDSQLHPWPEPKGSPPHIPNTPPIFNNVVPPFMAMNGPPGGFPPTGVPPFAPPGFIPPMMRPPAEWNGIPNGMPPRMPPPPQELMNQGPPPIFDNFGPNNIPDNGFQPPFNNQPPNMPMFPPNNFNNNNNMRGRGGPMRRGGGGGPWIRMGGPGPVPGQKQGSWNNRGGGGHNRGNNRFCHNVKKFGFCRHRDTCPFMHPN